MNDTIDFSQALDAIAQLRNQRQEIDAKITALQASAVASIKKRQLDELAKLGIPFRDFWSEEIGTPVDESPARNLESADKPAAARNEVTKEQFDQLGPKAWDDYAQAWDKAKAANEPFDAAKKKLAPYFDKLRAADFTRGKSDWFERAVERLNEALEADQALATYLTSIPKDGIFSEEELPRRRQAVKHSKDQIMRSILREKLGQ
jgi:hypothetical protein